MPAKFSKGGDAYIIEFLRLGNAVKVSACDPATLTEVSIVGSAGSPDWMLERAAVRKLEAVLDGRQPGRRASPR